MKTLSFILMLFFPAVLIAQQNRYEYSPLDYMWMNVGNPGFSAGEADYTSLSFSASGEPCVAFKDYPNSRKISVMKFDGTNWVPVGTRGFSSGEVSYVSLAFSASGEPYVAYCDYVNSYKTTVMKFDGSNWVVVGNAGFSAGFPQYVCIAFSPSGQPYVAFEDEENDSKATVMKYDGTDWLTVGSAGFSNGESDCTSLAFSSAGQPYVAFGDSAGGASVMKFDSVFTAINETAASRFSVFPNPANDEIIVEVDGVSGISNFSILNADGQTCLRQKIADRKAQINIGNLPGGVYIMKLTSSTKVLIERMIKL